MKKMPVKAYKNLDFLLSSDARSIRVLCELTEPKARLKKHNIENAVVFFGSARAKSKKDAEKQFKSIEKKYKNAKKISKELENEYKEAETILYLSQYYEKACEFSFKLSKAIKASKNSNNLIICTGGGGGIMEAINKGAHDAGAPSIGFNISLPLEQHVNEYVTEDLAFEFHYFFIRKFWFVYLSKALIIFPGGFGTLDEMMEALTLMQTEKIDKNIPIVVFGKEYWNRIINFDEMIKLGTIDKADLDLFKFFDDVDEAIKYLVTRLKL